MNAIVRIIPLSCPSSAPVPWFPYFLQNSFFEGRFWSLLIKIIKIRFLKIDDRLKFIQITTFISLLIACEASRTSCYIFFYFFSVRNVHFDYSLCFIDSFKPWFMVQKKRILMKTYFHTGASSNSLALIFLMLKLTQVLYTSSFLWFRVFLFFC